MEKAVFPSPDWSLEDLEDWILMEQEAIEKEEEEMAQILATEKTIKEEDVVMLANELSVERKTRQTVNLGTGKTTTSMQSHGRKHRSVKNHICNSGHYGTLRHYGNHKLIETAKRTRKIKKKLRKLICQLADNETKNCEKWRKISWKRKLKENL